MAAIYATKKSGGFIKNNWKNLLVGGLVLFIGYKISQGVRDFKFPMLPSLGNPFADFKFPSLTPSNMISGIIMDADPALLDPNRITYTPITTGGQPVTSIMQDMMGNILYNGMMQPNIVEAGGNRIDPSLQSMAKDYAPVDIASVDIAGMFKKPIAEMLQVGLAIDAPTRARMSPMASLLDKVVSMVRPTTARALTVGGGDLTALSMLNPNLTASQLADLKFRLSGENPMFDFGRNTGSGRIPIFDVMGKTVIATQRNPVLQAYEAYKAQYGSA